MLSLPKFLSVYKEYILLIVITLIALFFRLYFTLYNSTQASGSEIVYFQVIRDLFSGTGYVPCSSTTYSLGPFFCAIPLAESITLLEVSVFHLSTLVLRANTIILSTAITPMTYFAVRKVSRNFIVAVLASLFLATDGYFALNSSLALPDSTAFFLLLAGILCYLYPESNFRFILTGGIFGLALLCDVGAIFFVFGVASYHFLSNREKQRIPNTAAIALTSSLVFLLGLQVFDLIFRTLPPLAQEFHFMYQAAFLSRQPYPPTQWNEFSSIFTFNAFDWITLFGNVAGLGLTPLLLACSIWVPVAIYALVRASRSVPIASKALVFALVIFAWNFLGAMIEVFFSLGEAYNLYFTTALFASSIGTACLFSIVIDQIKSYSHQIEKAPQIAFQKSVVAEKVPT